AHGRWRSGAAGIGRGGEAMLVVMQEGADEAQTQAVIDRLGGVGFTGHCSAGVMPTVVGGVGPVEGFNPGDFEGRDGVQEWHRVGSPYKLASRHFRPGGTVVTIGAVQIGGEKVVMMAGPCSVEGEAQIHRTAELVARSGATFIRGGAF